MAKAFKDWEIDDIIAYCQEHNETEWLKATAAKTTTQKVYPRIKVQQVKNGVPQYTKQGNPKMVAVADKSQEPKTVKAPITFVEIKSAFAEKFGFAAESTKPMSMYDKIKNL